MKTIHYLVALAIVLGPAIAHATQHSFLEDFTSSTYKDGATTALWDTQAGELRLPVYPMSIVGGYDTPSFSDGVDVQGNYAYVADGSSGLQIFDITDPTNPTLIATRTTPGFARGVTVDGNLAYVADYTSGLRIVDVSDPTAPIIIGSKQPYAFTNAVAICENYAYLAVHAGGLVILDVSNPNIPLTVGEVITPDFAYDVVVRGGYAYVADSGASTGGLHVIDVSDPTNPVAVAYYAIPSSFGIDVHGDVAYVAAWTGGLFMLDVSDPTAPAMLGNYDTPGTAYHVWVEGSLAYVGDRASSVQVIDVSDPSNPFLWKELTTPGTAHQIQVEGEFVYIGDYEGGFQIARTADAVQPVIVAGDDTAGFADGVALDGNYAYVADASEGVQIYDVTDPTNPVYLNRINTAGLARGVTIAGNRAYIADYSGGMRIHDVSDPLNPVFLGSKFPYAFTNAIEVCGDYAYVAVHAGGLHIIDVSVPGNPQFTGQMAAADFAYDVVVRGDYAYVADSGASTGGLHVVHVNDPASPDSVAYYPLAACFGIDVKGDVAYLAAWSGGLHMLDVSDPASPTFLGSYDTPGTAYHVWVEGHLAYVGDRTGGLQIIDVTDPTNPVLSAEIDTPGQAHQIAVRGEFAFIGDYEGGFQVVQIAERRFDRGSTIAQSLTVDNGIGDVRRVRATAGEAGEVSWEVTANAGSTWQTIETNSGWATATDPGSDLRWRSTLGTPTGAQSPVVSNLYLEWLYDFAVVDSVTDVPDDNGGWARLHFSRSHFDFVDEASTPVTGYNVHRRIDDPALTAAVLRRGTAVTSERPVTFASGEESMLFVSPGSATDIVELNGRFYRVTGANELWEIVSTVFARQQDQYIALVPTLADATPTENNYTSYFVSAHTTTPSVFFDSPPDSGYSTDDIAPEPPQNVQAAYGTGSGNQLSWQASQSTDVVYYRVYRATDPNFEIEPAYQVGIVSGTDWTDPDYDDGSVHYKLTAVDKAENESTAASPGVATAVPGELGPTAYRLYQNAPNPFNPSTTIRYDVPVSGGHVTLRIYDVAGHLVQTLVDETQSGGRKSAVWRGTNTRGQRVATGVYFYRLQGPGFTQTLKMTLVQ